MSPMVLLCRDIKYKIYMLEIGVLSENIRKKCTYMFITLFSFLECLTS